MPVLQPIRRRCSAGRGVENRDNLGMSTHTPAALSALSTQDTTRIDDTRIGAVRPLITPALLQEWLPVPAAAQDVQQQQGRSLAHHLHMPAHMTRDRKQTEFAIRPILRGTRAQLGLI